MTTGQRQVYTDTVKLRIYFEGVLFPYAKSVTVTESEGSVSAQVEVPPSLKLRPDELAGMMCHIFYANKRVLSSNGDPGDNSPPIGKGWPILFQGELAGETTNTTVRSENVVLTFTSHARHFEQTQMYFYDFSRKEIVIDAYKQATFLGNTRINEEASGTALDKKTQILTTLTARIEELSEDEERNIAFTATVLDLLKRVGDNHAIFNYFDTKLKLSQRFAAYADPDVKNILKLEQLKHIIEQRAKGLPSYASVMQLLDIPTSLMKYNWNQLAQPSLRPERLPSGVQRAESADDVGRKLRTATQQLARQVTSTSTSVSTVLGTINIPQDYLPKINSTGTSVGYVQLNTFLNNIFVEYTRLLKESNVESGAALRQAFQNIVNQYQLPTVGKIAEQKRKDNIESGDQSEADAEKILETANEEDEKEEPRRLTALEQSTLVERDELNEFTITPSMEFSHPPKCNVLFPASFQSYGMTRNHLREPTRLYGRVDILPSARGADNIAIEWYIAPSAQAYHYLDGQNLARYSEAYEDFLAQLPNQIEEEGEE